jgi:hypothetical protein
MKINMKYRTLTDKQRKGFDMVIKFLNKKFPFIVGWDQYENWENYKTNLYIDLVIDLTKYKEYFNVPIRTTLIIYNKPYVSLTVPLTGLSEFDRINKHEDMIKEKMRNIYEALPQEYNAGTQGLYGQRYVRVLGVGHHRFINPPDEN